ncbi:MAG: hypothetical protein LV481_07390 [Methylacidiphilales bacterium]|nr:hypothetical protein [Candidatus Methylacidiphilales bacterium]
MEWHKQQVYNVDNLKRYSFPIVLAGILLYLGIAQVSFSQAQLSFTNGDFTGFSTAPPEYGAGLNSAANPDYTGGATLSSWSNTGYNFVFTNGNAGDITIQGADGDFELAGPNADGGSVHNGLALPTGYTGNVVALDPVYETGPLSQVVTGLTNGQEYAVTFDYAGAEQYNYNTATTENMSVALGAAGLSNANIVADGQTTQTLSNAANGFTGWYTQTFDFTADATSETLYFLAGGGPVGDPPFTLLADVTMTPVPEPATSASWTIFFGMLILLGNRAWRRHKKRPSTNT